jgi:uncharacterized membrane protein
MTMNKEKWQKILFWMIIIGVFGVCLYVKSCNLAQKFSYDEDEIFTSQFIENSWSDIIEMKVYDPGNPPLYHLMLKGWTNVFGNNEIGTRSLSLFCDVVVFWLIYFICRYCLSFGKVKTLVMLTLYAFSGILFYYSLYGRVYMFTVFVSMLEILLWFKGRRIVNFLFVIVALVGVYSHYSIIFFLFYWSMAVLIEGFAKKDIAKQFRRIIVNYTLIILGYLPWIVVFLRNQLNTDNYDRKYYFWQLVWSAKHMGIEATGWVTILSNGMLELGKNETNILILLFVLLLFVYVRSKYNKEERNINTVIYFVIIYALALFYFGLGSLLVTEKYSVFFVPIFLFSLTEILVRKNMYSWFLLCSFVVLWSFNLNSFYITVYGHGWKKMAQVSDRVNTIFSTDCYHLNIIKYYYDNRKRNEICDNNLDKLDTSSLIGDIGILKSNWDNSLTDLEVEEWANKHRFLIKNKVMVDDGYTVFVLKTN